MVFRPPRPASATKPQISSELLEKEAELMRLNQQLNQKKDSFFRQTEQV
jgi:hypothetical protein